MGEQVLQTLVVSDHTCEQGNPIVVSDNMAHVAEEALGCRLATPKLGSHDL